MLANIFYFFGLIVFLSNLALLTKFTDYLFVKEFLLKFEKVTGKKPEKKDFSKSNYEMNNFIALNTSMKILWMFVGLISQNWLFFLLYFFYNPLFSFFSKTKIKVISNSIEFIRLTIDIALICVLVINHFHFHLNLTSLILH
jgi:hypothetical protein